MKRFTIIVCVALLLIPGPAFAYLTQDDEITLTGNLETLSVGRSDAGASSANTILLNLAYSADDWETYFNKFFSCSPSCAPNSTTEHSFTNPLYDYLVSYVIFGVPADAPRINLQTGLINPLWTKINNIASVHPADLGSAMFNDALLRQSLFNGHRFFALLAGKGAVDTTSRTNVYINYKIYIRTYLQYFSDATTIDNFAQPFVALLRAQVWISFGQALPLDTTSKGEIAMTISLGGVNPKKLDIWNAFTVLVIDNNGLDSNQLNVIYDLLNGIPAGLYNLRYVTVRDFFSLPSWRVILNKGDTINYNLVIRPDNMVQFSFHDTNGQVEEFTTRHPLAPDTWNHVAATFDGNTVTMYINGVRDATRTATGLPNAGSSQSLELGRWINKLQWMRGKLDEVKIYSRALSAAEISDEYNNQLVSTANLVAYYKMNELSGTFVADSSGLGNSGTNVGATIIPGKVYNGLFFNGKDNYVGVSDNPSLRLAGAMTLESWVFVENESEGLDPVGSAAVNIIGCKVGSCPGNQFPPDISPISIDGFSIVAVHEFNHIVDSFYINGDTNRKARHDQLIKQAVSYQSDLQLLRSMVGWKFFRDNPQESFASISNEYFADSWHTFDVAIQRFDKGYKEPINQFLFFADIYSNGGGTTRVYKLNKKGVLTVNDAPIYRDVYGHITEIFRASTSTVYRFRLDVNGNVTAYTAAPATTP